MANTILTPTAVTREALRVLHQKMNFVGTITRDYDSSYAKTGAKIGDSLKIRLPNRYTVRTGRALNAQETTETSVTLQIATQKGVDVNFTTAELTLSLDDFSKRILQPAMAVLASNIEADAMSMYKDVYNQVNNVTGALSFRRVMEAGRLMTEHLAPTSDRVANLNTLDKVDLVDALKGIFNPAGTLSEQYREGMMGRTGGFDFYENTLWPSHTSGTAAGAATGAGTSSGYTLDGAQEGSAITVVPGSNAGTLVKGDIITMSGLFRVHPESKTTTPDLLQMVVTTTTTASAVTVNVSPAIVTSGATQNVNAIAASATVIYKVGTTSDAYGISMAYHKEAFAFGTADLIMPEGVDFARREVYDGISMRIVRAYDINSDLMPCRIDVLYGYQTIRAQLAARLANN